MVILQGDIYWVKFPSKRKSEPAGKWLAVIIQDDKWNKSQINTTIVLAITSNLKYAKLPGNVTLRKGEANLPKSSVVNITQIKTIDKSYCLEKIGKLSLERLKEILTGLQIIFGINKVGIESLWELCGSVWEKIRMLSFLAYSILQN